MITNITWLSTPLIRLVFGRDVILFGVEELLWCNIIKAKRNTDKGNITDTLGVWVCYTHHMILIVMPTFSSQVFSPSVVNMSIRWSWAIPQSSATFSTNRKSSVRARTIWGSRVFPCWLSSSERSCDDHMILTKWHTIFLQHVGIQLP